MGIFIIKFGDIMFIKLEACPFCGHLPDQENLIDSLHPSSGVEWYKSPDRDLLVFGKDIDNVYTSARGWLSVGQNVFDNVGTYIITEMGQYWEFHCLETEGGCGVQMTGHNQNDVIDMWNRRQLINRK